MSCRNCGGDDSVEAVVVSGIEAGMVDVTTGAVRLTGDHDDIPCRDCADQFSRAWNHADQATRDEVDRLMRLAAEYHAHLRALCRLSSVAGTDVTLALATMHRQSCHRLASELGRSLKRATWVATIAAYQVEPGARWPWPTPRHINSEDCGRCECKPPRCQGVCVCGCPVLFDWEVAMATERA